MEGSDVPVRDDPLKSRSPRASAILRVLRVKSSGERSVPRSSPCPPCSL